MSLSVSVYEKEPGIYILTPDGSLDTNTYQILETEVETILKEDPFVLIFDLEKLKYISSMGIRVVIKASKSLKEVNGKLILTNLQPQIEKVFEIIKALPNHRVFKNTDEMDSYLNKIQNKIIEDKS
ncbi:MAG: STAS domain-containing protein [Thermodesulfobacteriota bacterium]